MLRPASEWAEEHVRSRQKGCHEMATWIAMIQADAEAHGFARGIEEAARVCDLGCEQWYAAKEFDRHELVGSALHVAANDIRSLKGPAHDPR